MSGKNRGLGVGGGLCNHLKNIFLLSAAVTSHTLLLQAYQNGRGRQKGEDILKLLSGLQALCVCICVCLCKCIGVCVCQCFVETSH